MSVNISIIQPPSPDASSEAFTNLLGNLLLRSGLQGVIGVTATLGEGQFKLQYKKECKGPALLSVR